MRGFTLRVPPPAVPRALPSLPHVCGASPPPCPSSRFPSCRGVLRCTRYSTCACALPAGPRYCLRRPPRCMTARAGSCRFAHSVNQGRERATEPALLSRDTVAVSIAMRAVIPGGTPGSECSSYFYLSVFTG